MNFNLPTTLGDWAVIAAAVIVTHIMFIVGGHIGLWHTANGHIQLGSNT